MSDTPSPYDLSAIRRGGRIGSRVTEGRGVVISGLQYRIAELEAEVERLRADGERLDWMQKNPASSEPKAYWSPWFRSWVWRHMGLTHLTLRAAIDAARKEKE